MKISNDKIIVLWDSIEFLVQAGKNQEPLRKFELIMQIINIATEAFKNK